MEEEEEQEGGSVGWHRRILGWGNLVHDTTTTKYSAVGNAWAGWGSIPVFFFPLDGRSPVSHPTARSLSLQGDPANIGKG